MAVTMQHIPIDVVPDTSPPRFLWTQTVQSPIGPREVGYEGVLPPHVEGAVAALIALAKQQEQKIAELQRANEKLTDRIAAVQPAAGKRKG